MQQVLKQLIELQRLDSNLIELESLRGDLPHQVSRLNQVFQDLIQTQEDRETKLRAYLKEMHVKEIDMKALEGKKKKYQSQLFEVKTNREYDAVTHEIESVKSEISSSESRLIELMDLEKETAKAIEESKKDLKQLEQQLKEKEAELKKTMAKTEKEEAALKDRREKVLRNITPRILATYERISKAKNGQAVTPIVRNACGGCFKNLPPQRILEIRQMNRIFLCEVCGRILVWDEKASEGQD